MGLYGFFGVFRIGFGFAGGPLSGRSVLLRDILGEPTELHAPGRGTRRAQVVGHLHPKNNRIAGALERRKTDKTDRQAGWQAGRQTAKTSR